MAKPYCVIWNSTTKGKNTHLVDRVASKREAETLRDRHNRNASMGGFYSVHRCSSMSPAFRKEVGIEGTGPRRRRRK